MKKITQTIIAGIMMIATISGGMMGLAAVEHKETRQETTQSVTEINKNYDESDDIINFIQKDLH